jgi:RNA polymerase sigma factor (sigma-70 family)
MAERDRVTGDDQPMSSDPAWLAERFEENRPHLRAVALRMLGSPAEAEDAVQDAWLRLNRANTAEVENLGGWLTTVVARLCLDRLRARAARRETSMDAEAGDPIVLPADEPGPEDQAVLADSVGLAMLVVLETLTPAERLAFVLHDTFGVPFDEIASIVGRSEDAARQLASRARRRIRGAEPPATSRKRQWEVLAAFLAAARDGDFEALLRVLDPDVVARADPISAVRLIGRTGEIRGREAVARSAMSFRNLAGGAHRAVIDGNPGFVVFAGERPFAILELTIRDDLVVAIDILADPQRLERLDLDAFRRP